MDLFYTTHKNLIDSLHGVIDRQLNYEIDWSHPLIGIKGSRGVGKTMFLLDYARRMETKYGDSCLYVNLNSFYFTKRRIYSFADEFFKRGGKILLLDQIHKYPNWSNELRMIYDNIPGLKIVFSGSPVLRIIEGNDELKDIAHMYHLHPLSFREYLNVRTGNEFECLPLNDILNRHQEIVPSVLNKVRPLAYFTDYLKHGCYPFFHDDSALYTETLLKHVNLALEIDVTYTNQIELQYLPRLRKLMQIIADQVPFCPNVSKMSGEIDTSRATVMNYLRYLKNAKLLHLIYNGEEGPSKKPAQVYLHNTNLMYAISPEKTSNSSLRKTFFLNQTAVRCKVKSGRGVDFLLDNEKKFMVGGKYTKPVEGGYAAADMIEIGSDNIIPLWLFGFLY
ncbi:AAA family ATPase [Halosquirtibacter laminarini]|uniref:AAA family ATPase n=1 Tax=Halosquirtibacter laminarini TaxID=3374600 RepID=A0AC61NP89_9BACT|nr:AAA family ATPase [Prolixibacteraceae bacterium]